MKITKYALTFLLSFPFFADAGYILNNAKIDQITSTSGNQDEFAIRTSGGSGPCKDEAIVFTLADSGSPEVFDKTYSAALAAFAGGYTVDIHNYHDDTCRKASFIRLKK